MVLATLGLRRIVYELVTDPSPPPPAARADERHAFIPGVALALLFFVIGLGALGDYGVTWDEGDSQNAAATNLEILDAVLHSRPIPDFYPWEMPGYHFVLDTGRGLFTKLTVDRLGLFDLVGAYHFVHLVLSSLSILLLFMLVVRVGRSRWIALLAALTLALFPKFLGHSQNNPKDLPALFVFVLSAYCLVQLTRLGGYRRAILSGFVMGLAMTTHTLSFFVPVIFCAWVLVAARDLALRRIQEYGLLAVSSAVAFFASWPYLWADPWGRLTQVLLHVLSYEYWPPVLYLGRVYPGSDLPLHYFLVSFLVSTPVVFVIFALLSLPALGRADSRDADRRSSTWLASIWFVLLVLVEMTASSRYDGVRHFLMTIPAFCILVAIGVDNLWRLANGGAVPERFRMQARLAAGAWIGLSFLSVGIAAVRMHPYQDAYLNGITNALLPGDAADTFEVEYWGNAYREGAEWINRNAEPGAVVYVPWTTQADAHLATKGQPVDAEAFLTDLARPQYVMTITRKAHYNAFLHFLDRYYEPVFTVRRQKATLLKVFKNTHRPDPFPG